MTPTPYLRWALRPGPAKFVAPDKVFYSDEKILQQWWVKQPEFLYLNKVAPWGEWRDVPIEVEGK